MKYIVTIGDERLAVDVSPDGVFVDDERLDAQLHDVAGTPVRMVLLGNDVHRVIVRRGAGRGQYTLWMGGHRYEAEALDERTRLIRDMTAASAPPAGPAPVTAPMPGLIVRIAVSVGDQVSAGDGLVVMEAMKMENELRAAAGGRVRAVLAAPGQAVEKGMVLVELE